MRETSAAAGTFNNLCYLWVLYLQICQLTQLYLRTPTQPLKRFHWPFESLTEMLNVKIMSHLIDVSPTKVEKGDTLTYFNLHTINKCPGVANFVLLSIFLSDCHPLAWCCWAVWCLKYKKARLHIMEK
jgi:hypothetical protein